MCNNIRYGSRCWRSRLFEAFRIRAEGSGKMSVPIINVREFLSIYVRVTQLPFAWVYHRSHWIGGVHPTSGLSGGLRAVRRVSKFGNSKRATVPSFISPRSTTDIKIPLYCSSSTAPYIITDLLLIPWLFLLGVSLPGCCLIVRTSIWMHSRTAFT
jgi:hypothetical protein